MKKDNYYKLLGIAFVVAIVATGIFYGLLAPKLNSTTPGKMVVVAAKSLKPGTVLQSSDVKLMTWPQPDLPNGVFETVDQVAGKTVFDWIDEGEPVFASRLATEQSAGGSGVPSGMRAVSVHVTDSSGVIALLRAGQRVDVQVVTGRGENHDTTVRTALEGLQVISVSAAEQGSQGATLPVVTVLANPAQADVLAAADSGARVRLTLRNPLDPESGSRAALTLGAVMRASENPSKKSAK
ncbi:MAG TPA: Flp pilus assembly protein CpaB [Bryobacteraceae bacterium]|nr:Flp pilus assembly protein CpaB [Bryobacteraceae bacterium]